MAGAIAGTAILNCKSKTNNLDTVTITVNNLCNYQCPHCYLQYNSGSQIIHSELIDWIFNSDFKHISVVGQEPLFNQKSIESLHKLVEKAHNHSRTISFITNGSRLKKLPGELIPYFDYVDISFDGGFKTYSNNRTGSILSVIDGIEYLVKNKLNKINALHTIHSLNINDIDDLLSIHSIYNFSTILFSPYLITSNDGKNSVSRLPLKKIIENLSNNSIFRSLNNVLLLIDKYHIDQDGISFSELNKLTEQSGISDKTLIIPDDPIEHGIIRVTYDNLLLTPENSLHPSIYKKKGLKIDCQSSLQEMFAQIKEEVFSYAN